MVAATVTAAVRYIALYLRISKDRTGRVEGVGRQEKWGRAYVAQAIASGQLPDLPVRVFADNDVSAFDDDAHRPNYDALREAIRQGEVAAVWSVEQTRLEANRRRWVEFTIELDDAGIGEIHTNRDGIVRLDEVADVKNVFAWHERRRLRERLHDTLQEIADEGRPKGGVCYGYRNVRVDGVPTLEVIPAEAQVVHWVAEALLSGWSLASVCRGLNVVSCLMTVTGHQGVLPKRAGKVRSRTKGTVVSARWTGEKVRSMVTSPAVAGFRVHRGELHRRGNWEPILDEVTWRRLCSLLSTERSVRHEDGTHQHAQPARRPFRKYLLTGLVFCGLCGHYLTGRRQWARTPASARYLYFCLKTPLKDSPSGKGCSRIAIVADKLETEVADRFLKHIDSEAFRAHLAADQNGEDRSKVEADLHRVDQRRTELARRWASGDLEDAEWDAARSELAQRTDKLNARLAAIPQADGLDPDAIIADWQDMSAEEQRHLLGMFLARIVILPAGRVRNRFDPARVEVYDLDGKLL